MSNNDVISLEQLYKMLHISKRKAAWMLQNGIIPCEIRNTQTHKYFIKRKDVIDYINKNEIAKQQEIPIGIFNYNRTTNPHRTESQDSVCGGSFYSFEIILNDEERELFKEMLENLLKEIPDILTVKEVAELTGYNRKTILRYAKKKYIFTVSLKGKLCISKQSLIEYFSSDIAFKNKQKTRLNESVVRMFVESK
jgi:hypothetical protein